MRRSIVFVITLIIVTSVATIVFSLVEVNEQPHVAFINEKTAERITGQNYTLSSLTISTGEGLPYAPFGNRMTQAVLYTNSTNVNSSGTTTYYFFQDNILLFNSTGMAQKVYQMELPLLSYGFGSNRTVLNGTYKGFQYSYLSVSQKIFQSKYFWEMEGFSGKLVFVIIINSPLPLETIMSSVAINQIDEMTAFHV